MRRLTALSAAVLAIASCSREAPVAPLDERTADELRLARHGEASGVVDDPAVKRSLEDARRRLLAQATLDAALAEATSEAHLREAYASRRDALTEVEVHIAQIVLGPGVDGGAALSRLRAGEAFETVARELSADKASAARGGLLPPIRASQVSPTFFEAASRLEDGQTSDILTIGVQRHILKAVAPATRVTPTFEEARARLTADLMRERSASLLDELRTRYPDPSRPQ